MKIWIDVCHIPQYNFFKQLMLQLVEKGHTVVLTVMDRGRTVKIVRHEIGDVPGITIVPMGKHKMTRWSAIWDANLMRMLRLLFWLPRQHFDVALSTNIFTSLFGKIYGIRNYSFGDDPQVYDLKYNCRWATQAHQCIYEWSMPTPMPKNLHILPCLKEWAYLAPNVFTPNSKALEKYGVRPKEYIFLREVSVGTVNYAGQAPQAILAVKDLINSLCQFPSVGVNTVPSHTGANTAFYADSGESLQFCASGGEQFCNLDGKTPVGDAALTEKADVELAQKTDLADNAKASIEDAASGQIFSSKPCASAQSAPSADHPFKVLFSLEEKNRRGEYPDDWILLQEPIEDIHSLMYYSAGLVSSGDSMAREAALLGIPAYYLGTRHSMPANLAASKVANLQNERTQPFVEWLRGVRGKSEGVRMQEQDDLRKKIDACFIDINEYMMSLVEKSATAEKRSFWKEAWTWIRTPKSYELNQCAKDLEYK